MPRAMIVLEQSRGLQVRMRTDRLPVLERPRIGGVWRAKPRPTTVVVKGYIDPPSAERVGLGCACRFPSGGYLGVIHEVEVSQNFVSVRVPDPGARSRLVWVNVMRVDATVWLGGFVVAVTGHPFAEPVPAETLRIWTDDGWEADDPLYRLPPEESIMTTLPFARRAEAAPWRARLLDSPSDQHGPVREDAAPLGWHGAPARRAQDDGSGWRWHGGAQGSQDDAPPAEYQTPFFDLTLPIADTGATDADVHVD